MPKYGRPVDHGDSARMIDVIDVPDGVVADDWLTMMFKHNKAAWQAASQWFVQVHADVKPSAKYNGGGYMSAGNFTNPTPPTFPMVLDGTDWMEHAYRALGAIELPEGTAEQKRAAGAARYGAILQLVRASTDDMHVIANEAYENAKQRGRFTRAGVGEYLTMIAALLEAGEKDSIINTWPTGPAP